MTRNAAVELDADPVNAYQLVVIAANVRDATQSVGGLMADLAMASWRVAVLITGPHDDRPIRILGARTDDVQVGIASLSDDHQSCVLAVASDVIRSDIGIRKAVERVMNRRLAQLALWGNAAPIDLPGQRESIHYRPSVAAQHFKACALDVAAAPRVGGSGLETLTLSRPSTCIPLEDHLGNANRPLIDASRRPSRRGRTD